MREADWLKTERRAQFDVSELPQMFGARLLVAQRYRLAQVRRLGLQTPARQ
ncbi:hypothetical protein HLB44_34195 [Aquincola sp. S2]|uniref:Uncharacterized protein n=1 Tax=Pseudaquabacterium terrae TaxID=2732868 RepID=A0ABX2ETS6_9BURK|nr:hypothetical protein [Aquabacterium terrae]NRF72048.1 hypothetical protein [Aquabacterium terrae]